jgi:hypothetical protein
VSGNTRPSLTTGVFPIASITEDFTSDANVFSSRELPWGNVITAA